MTTSVRLYFVIAGFSAFCAINSGYSQEDAEFSMSLMAQHIAECLEAMNSLSNSELNSTERNVVTRTAVQSSKRALSMASKAQEARPGFVNSLFLTMAQYCELRIQREIEKDMDAARSKQALVHQLLLLAEQHGQVLDTEVPNILEYRPGNSELEVYRQEALRGSAHSAKEVAWYSRENGDYIVSYGWHYLWFLLQMRTEDKPELRMASEGVAGMQEIAIRLGGCSRRDLRNIEQHMFDVFMTILIEGAYDGNVP